MKSLHIIHRLYPEYQGGTEIHVSELCQGLTKAGEDLVIFTTKDNPALTRCSLKRHRQNQQLIYVFEKPVIKSTGQALYRPLLEKYFLIQAFIWILQTEKPDLIHFHHLITLSSLFLPITWIARIPYCLDLVDYWYLCPNIMLTCQGSLDHCATYCLWQQPRTPLEAFLARTQLFFFKDFYGYWAVIWHRIKWQGLLNFPQGLLLPASNRTASWYKRLNIDAKRMLVKPCGIKPIEISSSNGKKTHLVIGFLGTLMEEKGTEILIKAFKQLSGKDYQLHLYGHNRYSQAQLHSWQKQDSRVRYFGEVDHKNIYPILKTLDILVVPSLVEETYSLVANEGLMAKLPVIVGRIGALAERIIEGKNGFLVEPGNVEALTEKLAYVVKHYYPLKRRLNFDLNQYTIDKEVSQLQTIYDRLVNG